MKNLIELALERKVVTYVVSFLILIGGIASFFSLGQLEDPVFSIKTAVIITNYPGAGPEEVELEVTDRLELAIQELSQVKDIYSISRAGQSYIKVDIKDQYWSEELPQIWDELRRKIHDAEPFLPPEAGKPAVNDDFGNVFGFVLAVTGEGYSYRDLEEYAKLIKKEITLVEDVARVNLWGARQKVVYVDVSEQQISELKLTPETFLSTLKSQNEVVDAGSVDNDQERFRIAPTGEFSSPEEIGELIIRPRSTDIVTNALHAADLMGGVQNITNLMEEESERIIQLKDIARIRTGYREPPHTLMRFDGKPAIGIAIAGTDDSNIVTVGSRLDDLLDQFMRKLPVGIEVHRVAWQSEIVDEAVNGFLVNFFQALAIVMVVLVIPSGFRIGAIIGIDLILTVLATFIVMAVLQIPLQRMSLGALIIALGMMVDNSIVISDNIAVQIRQGTDRIKAAVNAACSNYFPLLAATLVAVMTFYPIFASIGSTGEYCATLFIVVATALLLSWLFSLTLTPLKCVQMLPEPPNEGASGSASEYDGAVFRALRKTLRLTIRFRFATAIVLVALLAGAIFGFAFVEQMFFPESTRPQLMVDYWGPEGVRIQNVDESVAMIEEEFLKNEAVESVAAFVGAGPPRFYLPVDSERPNQNYAQLVLTFHDFRDIDAFIEQASAWTEKNVPQAMIRYRKYSVGPGNPWPFELRITGPGEASAKTLRSLANRVSTIAEASPYGTDWRLDIMNPVLIYVPEYDQKRGRWASVTRNDLARASRRSYDGNQVGLYREGDSLYPIILRATESERRELLNQFGTVQIAPSFSTWTVPVAQVISRAQSAWEDPIIARWNRRRQVAVQGVPKTGVTFPTLKASVSSEIDKIKLPAGFNFFWDGEAESSASAQEQLIPGLIPAIVVILILLVLVFNALRPVLIILITIPFAFIGITLGLLVFNIPFGFMALLGGMSLAGMMNKNIVVLLDEAEQNLKRGMNRYNAIIEASVSRARPVLLAAGTTILGVAPLLQDVFWVSMATTIMAGLAFGSLLTLVCVPVFYAIIYKVKGEQS